MEEVLEKAQKNYSSLTVEVMWFSTKYRVIKREKNQEYIA